MTENLPSMFFYAPLEKLKDTWISYSHNIIVQIAYKQVWSAYEKYGPWDFVLQVFSTLGEKVGSLLFPTSLGSHELPKESTGN